MSRWRPNWHCFDADHDGHRRLPLSVLPSSPFDVLFYCVVDVPVCPLLVVWQSNGIVRSTFLWQRSRDEVLTGLQLEFAPCPWLAEARDPFGVAQFLSSPGENFLPRIPLVPNGSLFQRKVWQTLLQVPCGQVTSYSALAFASGFPRASRAVGHAMATNPLPGLVPCHRVIRQDGQIGRFGYGAAMKQQLLEWEARRAPDKGVETHV